MQSSSRTRSGSHVAAVQDPHQGDKKDQWMRLPQPETSVTSIASASALSHLTNGTTTKMGTGQELQKRSPVE